MDWQTAIQNGRQLITIEKYKYSSELCIILRQMDRLPLRIGTLIPMFWDEDGCNSIKLEVNHRAAPYSSFVHPADIKLYFEGQKALAAKYLEMTEKLVGKPRGTLNFWVDETEITEVIF